MFEATELTHFQEMGSDERRLAEALGRLPSENKDEVDTSFLEDVVSVRRGKLWQRVGVGVGILLTLFVVSGCSANVFSQDVITSPVSESVQLDQVSEPSVTTAVVSAEAINQRSSTTDRLQFIRRQDFIFDENSKIVNATREEELLSAYLPGWLGEPLNIKKNVLVDLGEQIDPPNEIDWERNYESYSIRVLAENGDAVGAEILGFGTVFVNRDEVSEPIPSEILSLSGSMSNLSKYGYLGIRFSSERDGQLTPFVLPISEDLLVYSQQDSQVDMFELSLRVTDVWSRLDGLSEILAQSDSEEIVLTTWFTDQEHLDELLFSSEGEEEQVLMYSETPFRLPGNADVDCFLVVSALPIENVSLKQAQPGIAPTSHPVERVQIPDIIAEELMFSTERTTLTDLQEVRSLSDLESELENRVAVIEVNTWEEMTQQLWKDHGDLYEELLDRIKTEGVYFSDENNAFREAYMSARNVRDADTVRGVIVVKKSDFEGNFIENSPKFEGELADFQDFSLIALEELSFAQWEAMLREMRSKGADVPDNIELTIVVMPDSQLDGHVVHHGPDPGQKTAIPCDSLGDEYVFWSPGYDWMIYDSEPFFEPISLPVTLGELGQVKIPQNGGWNHEQNHLLSTMDTYRYILDVDDVIVNANGERDVVEGYVKGWRNSGIQWANFGRDDLMGNIAGDITWISALQIGLARELGVRNPMIDGLVDLHLPQDFVGQVRIFNDQQTEFAPEYLISYGITASQRDAQAFGEEIFQVTEEKEAARTRLIPSTFSREDLELTYMIGVTLELSDAEQFTLPIPNIFFLLNKLAYPHGENEEAYNLDIMFHESTWRELVSIQETRSEVKWIINTTILEEEELIQLLEEDDSQIGVVIADAEIPVSSSITLEAGKEFHLVWIAQRLQ